VLEGSELLLGVAAKGHGAEGRWGRRPCKTRKMANGTGQTSIGEVECGKHSMKRTKTCPACLRGLPVSRETPTMGRMAARAWVVAVVLAVGCGRGEEEPPTSLAAPADEEEQEVALWRTLVHEVDRRVLTERLERATTHEDVAVRRVAMRGMASLAPTEARSGRWLERGLRDPDAEVRSHASLGLGSLEGEGLEPVRAGLLGALAAEEDLRAREDMLWDLGRLGDASAIPALRSALESERAGERRAACEGFAQLGMRRRSVEPDAHRQVATRVLEDASTEVRIACAHAIARLADPGADVAQRAPLASILLGALRDEQPDVRRYALLALGRLPETPLDPVAQATRDPDAAVAVQAFRSLAELAAHAGDGPYAAALRGRLDACLGATEACVGPPLHVLLAALDAAIPLVHGSSTHGVAQEAEARLAALKEPSRGLALAHCAAARLADAGHGWPRRVIGCGHGRVPKGWDALGAVDVLARLEGAGPERSAMLRRLHAGGGPRVRAAVLEATPAVGHPDLNGLVLRGLTSGDRALVTTALRAIERLAGRWRSGEVQAPPTARLRRALGEGRAALEAEHYAAGLAAWADAVGVLGNAASAPDLEVLSRHPSATVRTAARRALERLGKTPPTGAPSGPADVVGATDLPASDHILRMTLETTAGTVRIALWPHRAPASITRLRELAGSGFYDGTAIHTLLPGFAVQAGDPRGDGHGGPLFVIRDELHRAPFDRGTVGLAHAGADTAGSQFFITLASSPHLTGRYTAVGEVIEGMEVVERWLPGDVLRSVRVSRETQRP
jgi:cyclophilin family peptidyl-prolyl cis-trans isomerase/HEAT repeat protein